MTGVVTALDEALIQLQLRSAQTEITGEAVLDTGFNGALVITPADAEALGISAQYLQAYELADGTSKLLPVAMIDVLWSSHWRVVLAVIAGGGALIGMTLLRGMRVTLDVVDRG